MLDSPAVLSNELCQAALAASGLAMFRSAALTLIGKALPFDAAIFHELSPRVPLQRAAIVAITAEALLKSSAKWDEMAVALGRLRELALEQGGAVTDLEAFPRSSRLRKEWQQRVAVPLGVKSLLMLHLVRQERIISAVLLLRRTTPFSSKERMWLCGLAPALTLADGYWQQTMGAEVAMRTQLKCEDQRLTARQREIVERVALGHTNRQIAEVLGTSENTVRNLLVDARRRVGAANRAELVRLAVLR
jgi:DNA-binding CsgD family transcriptional regulator